MIWPFRKHHDPQDAPGVAEARRKRDDAFDALDEAVQEVDRVHDRIVSDYEAAELDRQRGKR